ncbi:MAG TPA: beta-hydroxyacyl-ACP dehydratase [Prevotellaceae bacterium]|nr:beta-hydroxyacyl-ACP dehydratase [Prevotellaceae bacterium]
MDMLLENKFFRVLDVKNSDNLNAVFHVQIVPDCNVYNGHFPGDPVCPGVCNIETIKECASLIVGRQLRYVSIRQCRLTALATPTVCPEVDITVTLTEIGGNYQIQGRIADDKKTYMLLKGILG